MSTEKQAHILIIDDEDSYRTPVANHLRESGYVVDTAADTRQGLTLLDYAQGQYDIVFVDQLLHGEDIDGVQFVSKLKELYPDLPVVIVTGWGSPEKGLESLSRGAYRYVSKSAGVLEIELLVRMASEIKQQTENSSVHQAILEQFAAKQSTSILAVFANPRGSNPLRLGAEERVIRECIKLSHHRDNVHLNTLQAATIHDVRRALLEQKYRVIHFSGHGTGSGLVLEDAVGQPKLVPPDALADFLSAYSPPIECAILNACYSRSQGELLRLGIPYTIVTDGPISDGAATEFTRGFYDAIGAGKGIKFAYEEGCRAVRLTGYATSEVPLLLRQ